MKRQDLNPLYFIFLIFGLIWVVSCTRSPRAGVNVDTYNLSIEMQPNQVYADTGEGLLYCFLTLASNIVEDEYVYFRCTSSDVSNANISGAAKTSATAPSGTQTDVIYHPVDYAGIVDTIYAVYYYTYPTDTAVWAMTTVDIIHPVLNMSLSMSPATVYSDTGKGLINCILTSDGVRIANQDLEFRAASSNSCNSYIDPFRAKSSTITSNGTTAPVYYHPNNFTGFKDTIYAVWLDEHLVDTLKLEKLTIDVFHP